MTLATSNSSYSSKNYWDQRFTDEDTYDWLCSYSNYKDQLQAKLTPNDEILVLGCGNSQLSYELYNAGFRRITNVDYSETVIRKMREKHRTCPEMKWLTMDILDMSFADSQFNVIIEKCTLDVFLVDEKNPWRVSDAGHQNMHTILYQVSCLLSPGGKFISISFAQPHFRKLLLADSIYDWSIATETFGDNFHFYIYTMVKGETISEKDALLVEKYKTKKTVVQSTFMEEESPEEFIASIMAMRLDET